MKLLRGLWLLAFLMPVFASHAAVTVTIEESGSDVAATASGSLVLPACNSTGTAPRPGIVNWVANDDFAYIVGSGSAGLCTFNFTTVEPLNSLSVDVLATANTGGPVGVESTAGGEVLIFPAGYTSGNPINATSTWQNQTLATLQLTPGIYVFDFGTDTITFNVGAVSPPAAAQAVPANSWFALLLAALGAMVVGARRFRS